MMRSEAVVFDGCGLIVDTDVDGRVAVIATMTDRCLMLESLMKDQ